MIERKFIKENLQEFQVHEFIRESLKNVGHSHTKLLRTPLGEKIIIFASRPGLIVGRKGENIKKLTNVLKKRFNFENPQIEIAEVENPDLDAQIVAERIASTLERFGIQKFKAIGHKTMQDAMNAGALGIEIIMSGKVPSARAKSWRFYSGYLKKSGDVSLTQVKHAQAQSQLKPGTVGVKVSIMTPDVKRPDDISVLDSREEKNSQAEEKTVEQKATEEEKKEQTEQSSSRHNASESKPKKTRQPKEKKEKVDEKTEQK